MKILFCGLGSIGIRHARILHEEFGNSVELISYRTGKGQTSLPDGLRDSISRFDSLEAALDNNPDVAFVTNPTAQHISTAIQCAKRSCDLFVEKPLGASLDRYSELRELVVEKSLITMVACQLRFHPILQTVKNWLEESRIGTVYSFRAEVGSYLPDWRPDHDYRKTYSASRSRGGGVLLDLIHELDYADWLFGSLESLGGLSSRVSELDIETGDVAELIFRLPGGGLGNIHLDYLRDPPRRRFELFGPDGSIEGDLIDETLQLEGNETIEISEGGSRDVRFKKQLKYFLDCVERREPTFNRIQDQACLLESILSVRDQKN